MSNITRTFFTTNADVKIFDTGADDIVIETFTFPGKVAINDIKKIIEKSPVYSAFTVLKVVSVNYDEFLYCMSEHDFMRYGKPADERSKETRNAVTKEIIGYTVKGLGVDDKAETISGFNLLIPRKMGKDEAKRFLNKHIPGYTVVRVDSVDEVKQLYYMGVDDFKAKAEKLPPRKIVEK